MVEIGVCASGLPRYPRLGYKLRPSIVAPASSDQRGKQLLTRCTSDPANMFQGPDCLADGAHVRPERLPLF